MPHASAPARNDRFRLRRAGNPTPRHPERPDDDAIIEGAARISYRRLAATIAQFTAALRDLGVAPGELVVVRIDSRFVHLMVLFACERIGAPSASLTPPQCNDGNVLFRRAGRIIADGPVAAGRPSHQLTREWIDATIRRTVSAAEFAALAEPPDPTAAVRYTTTSGTTGDPKVLRLDWPLFTPPEPWQDPRLSAGPPPASALPVHLQLRGAGRAYPRHRLPASRRDGHPHDQARTHCSRTFSQHRPHCAAMVTGTVARADAPAAPAGRLPQSLALSTGAPLSTTGALLGGTLRDEVLRRLRPPR